MLLVGCAVVAALALVLDLNRNRKVETMIERGWEYRCECGARVSSGWADPMCPMPGCGRVMMLIHGPQPTDREVEGMLAEAEAILREPR